MTLRRVLLPDQLRLIPCIIGISGLHYWFSQAGDLLSDFANGIGFYAAGVPIHIDPPGQKSLADWPRRRMAGISRRTLTARQKFPEAV